MAGDRGELVHIEGRAGMAGDFDNAAGRLVPQVVHVKVIEPRPFFVSGRCPTLPCTCSQVRFSPSLRRAAVSSRNVSRAS